MENFGFLIPHTITPLPALTHADGNNSSSNDSLDREEADLAYTEKLWKIQYDEPYVLSYQQTMSTEVPEMASPVHNLVTVQQIVKDMDWLEILKGAQC